MLNHYSVQPICTQEASQQFSPERRDWKSSSMISLVLNPLHRSTKCASCMHSMLILPLVYILWDIYIFGSSISFLKSTCFLNWNGFFNRRRKEVLDNNIYDHQRPQREPNVMTSRPHRCLTCVGMVSGDTQLLINMFQAFSMF